MTIIGGLPENKDIGLNIDLNGTNNNTEINESGHLVIKKAGVDGSGSPVYEKEGYWTSDVIDLSEGYLDFGKVLLDKVDVGSSSVAIQTRSSLDNSTWSEWIAIAMDGTIQSEKNRFFQVRIDLFAGFETDIYLISDFDDAEAVSLFTPNDYIDTANGLRLKRNYELDMALDTSWVGEGSLHRKVVTRDEWVKIDKMNVLPKE